MFWITRWLLLGRCLLGEPVPWLQMVDPVAVGHVRRIQLTDSDPGRVVEMRTLALNPPIFYVAGLLDASESDAIIEAANASGAMFGSRVNHPNDDLQGRSLKASSKEFRRLFKHLDSNRDNALNAKELQQLLQMEFDVPNHEHDTFLARYSLTSPSVSLSQLKAKNVDFGEYVQWFTREQPHRRSRFSLQSWLNYKLPATRVLLSRVKKITDLPANVIKRAENLQVLRYPLMGHYSCHHDSGTDDLEEGHQVRIATVAVFLNEAEGGGEIAFPGADHPKIKSYGEEEWSELESICQPTKACTQLGGVVVKPKKGDAVWWYNMKASLWARDGSRRPGPEALYWNSMHCGAEVTAGEKWMANLWLHSPARSRRREDL